MTAAWQKQEERTQSKENKNISKRHQIWGEKKMWKYSYSSVQPAFPPTLFLGTSANDMDDVTATQWQHKWIGVTFKIVLGPRVEKHTLFCLKGKSLSLQMWLFSGMELR